MTGVRSRAASAGACSGGLLCGGTLSGRLLCDELLIGGEEGRIIIRMIGSFCMASMSPCGRYAGKSVGVSLDELPQLQVVRTPEAIKRNDEVALDPSNVVWIISR